MQAIRGWQWLWLALAVAGVAGFGFLAWIGIAEVERRTGPSLETLISTGDIHALDRWFRGPADVNKPYIFGMTPLHIAAYNGKGEVVEFLLSRHADVSPPTSRPRYPFTPLETAALQNHPEIVERLRRAGAPYTLCAALLLRDMDTVERRLAERPDAIGALNANRLGLDLLYHNLVRSPEVLVFMLDHGLDPNGPVGEAGAAPLTIAALLRSNAEATKALLEHGAHFMPHPLPPSEAKEIAWILERQKREDILALLRAHGALPPAEAP